MARSLPVENLLPQNVGSIINYLQWFAVSHKLQSTTTSYGQWRQRRQIQLTGRIPHPTHGSTPWAPRIAYCNAGWAANHKTCYTEWAANVQPSDCQTNALPVRPLRVYVVNTAQGVAYHTVIRQGCPSYERNHTVCRENRTRLRVPHDNSYVKAVQGYE